jgi:hypothetical protein
MDKMLDFCIEVLENFNADFSTCLAILLLLTKLKRCEYEKYKIVLFGDHVNTFASTSNW